MFTDSITALELWHDSYSHTIAKKARDVSLSAAKIAVRDSKGKVIGYRPRNILGDTYSNIFTMGNPESAGGRKEVCLPTYGEATLNLSSLLSTYLCKESVKNYCYIKIEIFLCYCVL